MALTIPDRFSPIRSYIEKRYKADEAFRDIYDDYLTYLEANRFWSHNSTDVAPVRHSEYTQLVSEMEKELIQMLKKDPIKHLEQLTLGYSGRPVGSLPLKRNVQRKRTNPKEEKSTK